MNGKELCSIPQSDISLEYAQPQTSFRCILTGAENFLLIQVPALVCLKWAVLTRTIGTLTGGVFSGSNWHLIVRIRNSRGRCFSPTTMPYSSVNSPSWWIDWHDYLLPCSVYPKVLHNLKSIKIQLWLFCATLYDTNLMMSWAYISESSTHCYLLDWV